MTDTSLATVRRRGRPPASDSAVTRERILQAARKVFAMSGYDAATFQAIAVEIGLTRPAINNYFASKSDLYAEVAGRAGRAVLEAIRSASTAPTLAGQVIDFLRLTVHGEGADPALAGFLVQSAMDGEQPAPSGGTPHAAALVERFIHDAVAAAVRRGEVPLGGDIDALTDALTGLVWGTAFQASRGLQRDGVRADRMLGQLGALLDRELGRAG